MTLAAFVRRKGTAVIPMLGLGMVLSVGASTAGQDASGAAGLSRDRAVRAVIADAWHRHIEAAKRKDLESVTEIYADDIVYIVPGVDDVRGRRAIDAMEAKTLAGNDVLDAVHTIESLHVFGDAAYEIGTVVGPVREHGSAAQTLTFHFMALWRKQTSGAWRIHYMVGQPESPGG